MLSKQILILGLIFPFVEYYAFVAVSKSMTHLNIRLKKRIWVFYSALSVLVILSFFAFRFWATTQWPSISVKYIVNMLIGVFLGKLLVACVMAAGDILMMIKTFVFFLRNLFRKKSAGSPVGIRISRSQFISVAALVSGAVFTGMLGYGRVNRYRYKIHRVPLSVKGLPDSLRGLKIVHLSDIHAGSLDNRDAVAEGINRVMSEKPDLILFTGDLVNYRSEEVKPFLEILGKMKAPLGIYSVLGNHDFSDYLSWSSPEAKHADFSKLVQYQQSMGWKILRNENILLDYRNSQLALIGVDNWSIKERFTKYGDLNKAMTGVPKTNSLFRILMSHDPSHWDAKVRPDFSEIQLTLSGHTHGMQMGIEIPGIKWSPARFLYKQWAGLYHNNNQYLYVNRGYGYLGYEGRLGILPEIAVFELI